MVSMRTQDQLRLLRKIGLRKIALNLKTYVSYQHSKFIRNGQNAGKPISISIEPTTACNLGCPECPSGLKAFTRATGNLKIELWQNILQEIGKDLSYVNFYFQGEPYINPDFLKLVKLAHDENIYCATSTNGHFLNDKNCEATISSGLDRLIISVDGTSQEVYEQYRRQGNLEKVLSGSKNMVAWKKKLKSKTPYLIFQFLVVKPNEHQISEIYQIAQEIGIDEVRLKTAQVYSYENGNELIPENENYSRYKKLKNGKYVLKNKMVNHCWRMWSGCVITWDGKVVPCCFDKDAKHVLGDLRKQSFNEIWNGDAYRSFRQALLRSRKEIDICQNCSEGTKVWA